MSTGELITELIFLMNADGAQVNDTTLRARVLRAAQRGADRINTFRPYARGYVNGTVAMTNGVGSVPANFGSAGPKMSVWVGTNSVKYIHPELLRERLHVSPAATAQRPMYWTLVGQSVTGLQQILTFPPNATALTLNLRDYREKPWALVDRPGVSTVAATATAGLPDGTYTYKTTNLTADGETEGGVTSAPVTVSLLQIQLTAIPVSPVSAVTSRNIYRTAAGGEQHMLVGSIADNVTTTFLDNVADGSLGVDVPTPATAVSGLEKYPESHHRTAVFDTVYTLLAKAQGDGRVGELSQAAISAIGQMWADEVVTLRPRRLPRYGARRYV